MVGGNYNSNKLRQNEKQTLLIEKQVTLHRLLTFSFLAFILFCSIHLIIIFTHEYGTECECVRLEYESVYVLLGSICMCASLNYARVCKVSNNLEVTLNI